MLYYGVYKLVDALYVLKLTRFGWGKPTEQLYVVLALH